LITELSGEGGRRKDEAKDCERSNACFRPSSFRLHPLIPHIVKVFLRDLSIRAQAKFLHAFFFTALAHRATHFLEAVI
jgi:hypothetical protein